MRGIWLIVKLVRAAASVNTAGASGPKEMAATGLACL
jgi:hypothetical protein